MEGILHRPAQAAAMAEAARVAFDTHHAEAPVLARWRHFLATIEKPA